MEQVLSDQSLNLIQHFENQVKQHPGNIAVKSNSLSLSYLELNNRANCLARYISKRLKNSNANIMIPLCIDQGIDRLVGILGILKSGNAYVPIDPSYPDKRIKFILEDIQTAIILTEEKYIHKIDVLTKGAPFQFIAIDANKSDIADENASNLASMTTADSLAYVMYTSGSTGTPKGVMIPQRGITRLVIDTHYFKVEVGDAFSQIGNIAFDATTFEIWGALLNGASIILFDKADVLDLNALANKLVEEQITHTFLTTALFNQLVQQRMEDLFHLKYLLFGGEHYHPEIVSKISALISKDTRMTLLHVYGPTENTTFSTTFEINRTFGLNETLPIGKAITHSSCFVLDSNMKQVPTGEIGEMYVGGDGLALGYLNRPELSDEMFINHHFNDGEKVKIYRTGDLVSLLPDGNFEFVDRIYGQVKIRGHRIELGEVEFSIRKHPEVLDTVVLLKQSDLTKSLVAFLILEEKDKAPSVIELRDFLSKELPQYMIPTHFHFVDSIPLNHNGKIDKNKLLELGNKQLLSAPDFTAPESATEKKIAQIYARVLKEDLDKIGLHFDFFELGGDSLRAAQLVLEINALFNIALSIEDFLKNTQISKVAQKVEHSSISEVLPIIARGETERIPLSFSQEQIWLHEQLIQGVPIYNETLSFTIEEPIEYEIIRKALNEIVNRHEVLRARVIVVNGVPHQNILPFETVNLPYYDLSSERKEDRESQLNEIVMAQAKKYFDLENEVPLRCMLFKMEAKHYKLFVVLHHISVDGVAMYQVFKPELESLYQTFLAGKKSSLPELPFQYSDYIIWQQENENLQLEQLEYWKRKLVSLPLLEIPTDFPRPSHTQHQGTRYCFSISTETSIALKKFSQKEGATPFTTLLSTFYMLLHFNTQQEDLAVGTVVAGRNHPGLNNLIGDFLNTLILRTQVTGDISFTQLIQQVREMMLEAFAHQDCPLHTVSKALNSGRRNALGSPFQVAFVLEPALADSEKGWEMEQLDIHNGTSKFDLTFELDERGDGFFGRVEYSTELFKEESIKLMVEQYQSLLEKVISKPDQTIQTFRLSSFQQPTDIVLSEDETNKILIEWNKTDTHFPNNVCVHELIEDIAEKYPESIALVYKEQPCSYRELNSKANQLAAFLIKSGLKTEDLVCTGFERSIEMVIAMLGVMKAGGAYIPIDPTYPSERIAHIFDDSRSKILLTQESLKAKFPDNNLGTYCLDSQWDVIAKESPENHKRDIHSKNLIYVIYTSGSTGKPKGALIEHQGLVNVIFAHQRLFGQTHGDRLTQVSSPGFDGSACEIWPCLATGSTLYFVDDELRQDTMSLQHWLINNEITISYQPTPIGEILISYNWPEKIALKTLYVAGDRLNHFPKSDLPFALYNLYGPTETTIWATTALVAPLSKTLLQSNASFQSKELTTPHIGRPIENVKVYILDHNLLPVRIGGSGEIFIGGAGVGRGYLNKPELTHEKFIPSPFFENETLYKSGDVGRYLPDGNIEFVGRVDFQVKIRGFRIELGEIENVLRRHPIIDDAVAWVGQQGHAKKLVCYLIIQDNELYPTVDELKHFVAQELPEYMIPSRFCVVSHFPLTTNGKIDKKSLLVIEKNHIHGADCQHHAVHLEQLSLSNNKSNHVAPRTAIEKTLARIWENLLGVNNISIHDDFFMLGGESILSIQVVSLADQQGLKIAPRQISQFPTIAELVKVVTPSTSATSKINSNRTSKSESNETEKQTLCSLSHQRPISDRGLAIFEELFDHASRNNDSFLLAHLQELKQLVLKDSDATQKTNEEIYSISESVTVGSSSQQTNNQESPPSPIICLQKKGTKPPFFCIHPAGGSAYSYRELALALGQDQPFYGVDSVYGYEGLDIPTMASKYLQGILEIQTQGPYFIGGWSFGGSIAFEIAHQLQAQGKEVALLAMIDSRPVSNQQQFTYIKHMISDHAEILSLLGRYFQNLVGKEFKLSYEVLKPLTKVEQFAYLKAELKKHNLSGIDAIEEVVKNFITSFQHAFEMQAQHKEKSLNVKAFHYFRASEVSQYHENFPALEEDRHTTQDLTYGWGELSSKPIQIHEISGTHETIVFSPHVTELANSLRLAIENS